MLLESSPKVSTQWEAPGVIVPSTPPPTLTDKHCFRPPPLPHLPIPYSIDSHREVERVLDSVCVCLCVFGVCMCV